MTECERFIKEGLFIPDFFKEEVRCDFHVTSERKKIWAIGIDMLLKLDSVCRRHNLRYWLAFGSLLGAVRHKGFIPWDDDIDAAMMRADYDKLLTLGHEFEDPYFLEIPGECGYYYSHAKIRNSRTTFLSKTFAYERFNQGCMVDIFPIDNAMASTKLANSLAIEKLNIDNSTLMRRSNPDLNELDRRRVEAYCGKSADENIAEINRIATQYGMVPTDHVSCSTLTLYKYPKNFHLRSDFSSSVRMAFEGFEFNVPIGWRNILENLYGDYMQFPPIEKRGTWHSNVVIDPDRPYTEYLKEMTK